MSKIRRAGDLDIGEDMPFQRLEWKLERICWVVMAVMLLAALAGLFGPGLLSGAVAGERGSAFWCEYDRFTRYQAPNTLRVHIGAGASKDGKARLWLDRGFVENIELQRIDPEPEIVEALGDRYVYVFNVPDGTQQTAATFHFEPNSIGKMDVRLGLGDIPGISFWQFYYP